jgi:DNA-3-methyladenine glycosylase II
MVDTQMTLSTASPFRLDLTSWALRRREKNAVDRWDGSRYTRVIAVDSSPVRLTVTQETTGAEPVLIVSLHPGAGDQLREDTGLLVQKILGLTVDLQPFYVLARDNELLRPLVEQFSGVRPPRFPSVFEALVNSIACQQVTLDLGILLLNRLSERFGPAVNDHGTVQHGFPGPADLAEATEEALRQLGFSHQKARAIRELAADVVADRLDLASLDSMTNREAVDYLSTIRGIGRWSAEYVLLRGLGRLDTFPGDDVGAQNNLQRLFHLVDKPNYEQIRDLTSPWHPYEGLVYFHLLLEKLQTKGVL